MNHRYDRQFPTENRRGWWGLGLIPLIFLLASCGGASKKTIARYRDSIKNCNWMENQCSKIIIDMEVNGQSGSWRYNSLMISQMGWESQKANYIDSICIELSK